MADASAFELIERAVSPSDVFPDKDAARSMYRRLLRKVHPDFHPEDEARASAAVARLTKLWDEFNGVASTIAARTTTITTKKATYTLGDAVRHGDYASTYAATDDHGLPAWLRMARSPKSNDLVDRAIKSLRTVVEPLPNDLKLFHFSLYDVFRHRDASTRVERRAYVTSALEGFYTLSDVRRAYPLGIDARDMAWMFRRLLVGIGTAHDAGISHNAVTLDNVWVHPTKHGVILDSWGYSTELGEPMHTLQPQYRDMYPLWALDKKPTTPALDIHLASLAMTQLLRQSQAPRQIMSFFKGCRVSSPPPAAQLLGEFDELLERLYGKRKYRPLAMPATPHGGK